LSPRSIASNASWCSGRRAIERARDALLRRELQQLPEHPARLLLVDHRVEHRHRATGDDRDDGRHRLDLERLHDLRALVHVDLGEQHAPRQLAHDLLHDGAQLRALLEARGEQIDDHGDLARELHHLAETLLVDLHHDVRCGSGGHRSARGGLRRSVAEGGQVDGAAESGAERGVRHRSPFAEGG
jgi:hypothetical protein